MRIIDHQPKSSTLKERAPTARPWFGRSVYCLLLEAPFSCLRAAIPKRAEVEPCALSNGDPNDRQIEVLPAGTMGSRRDRGGIQLRLPEAIRACRSAIANRITKSRTGRCQIRSPAMQPSVRARDLVTFCHHPIFGLGTVRSQTMRPMPDLLHNSVHKLLPACRRHESRECGKAAGRNARRPAQVCRDTQRPFRPCGRRSAK